MFGESYFAIRDRLCEVMEGIAALAGDTLTDISGHIPSRERADDLHKPFTFIACGEVNCGKSMFLNGLVGMELCRTNVLPETRVVTSHKHGWSEREVETGPVLLDRHRPVDFLRNFELIDTPGTNSNVEGHQLATLSKLHEADFIFVVFPVSNPWGATTWDFVSTIPEDIVDRVTFIIQQSDQRGPEDLSVILGHMKDLSMKRTGRVPPMFAVSAKSACEAKKSADGLSMFKASGYEKLEKFIDAAICQSPDRRKALDEWRYRSALALREIEDRIEDQNRALNFQGRFLEEIEQEIGDMREQFVNRLPRHLSGVTGVFQTAAAGVARVLGSRLGAARSIARLFIGGKTGQDMERLFAERLQSAVESVAETDGSEVVEACRSHWGQLSQRVLEVMNVELGSPDELDKTLLTSKLHFVRSLGTAASSGIGNLKVRNQLDRDLRGRDVALKSFTFMTLVFLTAGATCGAFGLSLLPIILCIVSGIFLMLGITAAWLTSKSIKADFQERLLDTCGTFASTLRTDYEEALRLVFQDYAESLDIVRNHLAAEKLAVEPKSRRWKELFLTLKAIEQEI